MVRPKRFTDIDLSKIQFSEAQSGLRGGQTVFMKLDNEKILLQLPRMKIPFGISSYHGQGYTSYSMDMSLYKNDEFKTFITQLNGLVLSNAMLQAQPWFHTSTIAMETLEQYFYSSIRDDPKGKFASLFKLNLPIYDGKAKKELSFFNSTREEITFQDVPKGCMVAVIVELVGLWFQNKKFGIKWNITQVKTCVDEEFVGCNIDDSDDDGDSRPTAYLMEDSD